VAHHPFRRASQGEMLQSRPAAGCGNDQINFELSGKPADLFVGPASTRVEAHRMLRQGVISCQLL